ncbi:MAG: shikimate kinase [Geodermatophilaceae bacterium]|nr:shikimate kinase [Geodermatophilaceae bacterium]MDQ3465385.1 shikimate kinase [Actinomycetota bacterium]
MTRPVLVLVGAPGAGKTTVGAAVAARLGFPFRDTDRDIEEAAGRSISDIFLDDGEPYFRELERRAVATALRDHDGVLSVGGGAVLDEATRALLADHRVVYLSVGLADAARRVGLARDRPVLALNPRAQLHQLLEARRPLYESVAAITVATEKRGVDEVVDEVAGHVG